MKTIGKDFKMSSYWKQCYKFVLQKLINQINKIMLRAPWQQPMRNPNQHREMQQRSTKKKRTKNKRENKYNI